MDSKALRGALDEIEKYHCGCDVMRSATQCGIHARVAKVRAALAAGEPGEALANIGNIRFGDEYMACICPKTFVKDCPIHFALAQPATAKQEEGAGTASSGYLRETAAPMDVPLAKPEAAGGARWTLEEYDAEQCEVMGEKELHIAFFPNTAQGRRHAQILIEAAAPQEQAETLDAKALAHIWARDVLKDGLHEERLAKVFADAYAAGQAASGEQHHCGHEGYCQACCERTLMRYFDKTLPDGDVKQMLDRLAPSVVAQAELSEKQVREALGKRFWVEGGDGDYYWPGDDDVRSLTEKVNALLRSKAGL